MNRRNEFVNKPNNMSPIPAIVIPNMIGLLGPNRSIKYPTIGASRKFSARAREKATDIVVLFKPRAVETGIKNTVAL
tara:strand:- start:2707 stop:2937 length:231 start_codon:yes stop_codon:yes gene_type:complete